MKAGRSLSAPANAICLLFGNRVGQRCLSALLLLSLGSAVAMAQVPPAAEEVRDYRGLFAAAVAGDVERISERVAAGESVSEADSRGRTPLHVATFFNRHEVMRALVAAGADPNVLEDGAYDIVTIAAVAGRADTLRVALAIGCHPGNVTSVYEGTALIAAAHLGHHEVVEVLIDAGAPLDHVNNIGWTAVIESIVLGDGGPNHQRTLQALLDAGADANLPDRQGRSPLALARAHGFDDMVRMLLAAGAR